MTAFLQRIENRTIGEVGRRLIGEILEPHDTAVVAHDLDLMSRRLRELAGAYPQQTLHAVAIKANPLVEVLKLVVDAGCGLEAASYEEVALAVAAGCPPERIVFDSPAKTAGEISAALEMGVRINADNLDELDRIIELRPERSTSVVGLRVNPAVGSGRIATTSVASARSKFGEPLETAREGLPSRARGRPWIRGIHSHIGSQGVPLEHFGVAASRIEALRRHLDEAVGGAQFDSIDIGGGASTNYGDGEDVADPIAVAATVHEAAPELFGDDVTLITEFGRSVHANCGWALSRVEYVKGDRDAPMAIVHVGADMLLRTAYLPNEWPHEISKFPPESGHASDRPGWTVGGPLCFAGDIIGRDVDLGDVSVGDWLVVHDVGAYTIAMWSRHCSRSIPLVVGYHQGDSGVGFMTLRRRESPEDIVAMWSQAPGAR